MYTLLLPILPIFTVFACALLTRRVIPSLWLGSLCAGLIIAQGNPWQALLKVAGQAVYETNMTSLYQALGGAPLSSVSLDHLYTALFLLFLGMLMSLINRSGAIAGYTAWISGKVRHKKAVEQASLTMSCILFIDDYVSNLTVGAVMRPLVDAYGIARAKLAFLLDALSGSLCVLVPATSWVAFICAQLASAGISPHVSDHPLVAVDPLYMYLRSIPFMLYPLASVVTAWYIVLTRRTFGPMKALEQVTVAQTESLVKPSTSPLRATPWPALAPVLLFIMLYITLTLLTGGFATQTWSFSEALLRANSFVSLMLASAIATVTTYAWLRYQTSTAAPSVSSMVHDSWALMGGSIGVLWAAWTLASLMRDGLHIGDHIAALMGPAVSLYWLPLLGFMTSLMITATTGSAWGAMGLMLPLSIPLYISLALNPHDLMLLPALIGAIVAGAVAGGHCSPLTDAMVVASTAAGCPHFDHVTSHMAYALPAIIASCLGYVICALVSPWYSVAITSVITLSSMIVILLGALEIAHTKST